MGWTKELEVKGQLEALWELAKQVLIENDTGGYHPQIGQNKVAGTGEIDIICRMLRSSLCVFSPGESFPGRIAVCFVEGHFSVQRVVRRSQQA